MLECPPSPSRSMIDDTGSTHHAPSTAVTSYYRQRRREANLPKPDEREVLLRVHALHHRNEPAPVRHYNEYRAWHDLGTATNLPEGCYYADEATSDPACDAPTTRR